MKREICNICNGEGRIISPSSIAIFPGPRLIFIKCRACKGIGYKKPLNK